MPHQHMDTTVPNTIKAQPLPTHAHDSPFIIGNACIRSDFIKENFGVDTFMTEPSS